MQCEGKPKFLKCHNGIVRSVAFSPKDRYLFCSGAYDGKVNLYSALKLQLVTGFSISTMTLTKSVNAVRFSSDGTKILAATNGRRVAVVDVERGEVLLKYDNCAYSGRDRTGLATHPACPNMAICVAVNGNGLTLLDLRMPLPLDFFYDVHGTIVRDVVFAGPGWPWGRGQEATIVAGAQDGCVKACTLDGRVTHTFQAGHSVNTVCITPEPFSQPRSYAFYSLIMSGGEKVSAYVPESGIQEILKEHKDMPVWKLRYTSTGGLLYSVCDGGILRRYRRYPDHHQYLGEVYTHKADIQDLDISPYDEFLVTASKDKTVGVLRLGEPNHGYSEYYELT